MKIDIRKPNVAFCQKCVSPSISVNSLLDDDGVCSACRLQEEFDELDDVFWDARKNRFEELVQWAKTNSMHSYDCVIPVSGGKDSYFQVVKALEYGLNPLLVTYHGNNYLPEGQRNLDKMREVLGVDHMVFGPSVKTLKKLNLFCFQKMGDMNWHAHAGIKIFPMQIAVRLGIPLVLWGEITWSVSGMFSSYDYVEYNKRTVFEHDMRGYTIQDMVNGINGISENDLRWLVMPSDEDFKRTKTRGIYVGNFFKWDPNIHAYQMKDRFGFEFASKPFERTYRTMSNLDDMHENGIHDYLKFIKFGYGRGTDHASKDVRTGYMSRDEAVKKVLFYDHIKPKPDLARWLSYVNISQSEFDEICDTFRDPRVWWIKNGEWVKKNVDLKESTYGKVLLSEAKWGDYYVE